MYKGMRTCVAMLPIYLIIPNSRPDPVVVGKMGGGGVSMDLKTSSAPAPTLVPLSLIPSKP